jgi:hypothetical protein
MEIREIVSYHFDNLTENLEVSFKTLEDEDSVLRTDKISFDEIDSFGFSFLKESTDFYDDEDDEDDFDMFGLNEGYDEEELMSFLNEYYLVFPDRLPDSELY